MIYLIYLSEVCGEMFGLISGTIHTVAWLSMGSVIPRAPILLPAQLAQSVIRQPLTERIYDTTIDTTDDTTHKKELRKKLGLITIEVRHCR